MKSLLLFTVLSTASLFPVACTSSDESSAVSYCTDNSQDCANKYIQVAGGAASTDLPQVSTTSTTEAGQVPSTDVLPASAAISNSTIYQKATQVTAQLNTLNGTESSSDAEEVAGASTSTDASSSKVEASVQISPDVETSASSFTTGIAR